ncbi:MAG: peptidoglycan-associated lipoprotein Pal [Deltaproteobacteria bacterium]|nr:peptidoglycan-associated lipoprotein Pal [Deltaproteobacteria bacterium]
MKRGMIALLALSMAALVAGGCANKEVVKTEEPIAKPAPAQVEAPKQEAPTVEVAAKAEPEAPKPVEPVKAADGQGAKASEAQLAFEAIYFDFDKSDLRQDARDVLSKNAALLLKANNSTKIKIEGHCDERGSAEYNLALGERRAKSALQYLITLGVSADRLSTISYGKEKPAVEGHDEAAWAKNRRGEFVLVK